MKKNLPDNFKISDIAGYESMDIDIKPNVFEDCYLGFSFIVPETADNKEQQKFYSKVFRSINIEGKSLLPLESRAALYYLNKDLVGLFLPDFSKQITINGGKMDFVRCLSLLSQYSKSGSDTIAKGYSRNMESYYEKFIYAVVDEDEKTNDFIKLSEKIVDLKYTSRMSNLNNILNKMGLIRSYESIIELDLYMFGIVYHTIFEGKNIDEDKFEKLHCEIKEAISRIKTQESLHVKNPSALKYLRARIFSSIEIYKRNI